MAKQVRLKDIADKAGVSTSTVSQALANKGRVSSETHEQIKKIAEELGYQKGSEHSAQTIALLFSTEKSWAYLWVFIRVFIEHFEKALNDYGYNLVIITINEKKSKQEILNQLNTIDTKAVVTLHIGGDDLLEFFSKNGIPVLVVMNNKYQNKYLSVCNDDFQGAYDAVSHLIELGHQDVIYVGLNHPETVMMGNDRYVGAKKALEDSGYTLSEDHIILFENPDDVSELEEGLKVLLQAEKKPTAIYCLHDYLAGKVYKELLKIGIRIPDDISIITAGDSIDYDLFGTPQITTMRSQTEQMGAIAADMINRLINFNDNFQVNMGLKIRQQLVDRGSCIAVEKKDS